MEENSDSHEIEVSLLNNIITGMKDKLMGLEEQCATFKQRNIDLEKQQQDKLQ